MTTTYAFNTPCNLVCKNEDASDEEKKAILKKINGYIPETPDINVQYNNLLSLLQPCTENNNGIKINRPWTRFQTTCVSNDFKALDMRRKAEVLKYSNNANKLSKKQRYSMAARNLLTKRKSWANQKLGQESNPNTSNLKPTGYFSNSFDNTTQLSWSGLRCCKAEKQVTNIPSNLPQDNNFECKNVKTEPLKFSTTASDVPGKPIPLFLDPNVPLTMYTPVRRTYRAGANKWPQFGWYPGLRGFPVGKKGSLFP